MTDATSQKVLWRWEGGPFGTNNPKQDPQSTGTQFVYSLRFPGQYWDNEISRMSNGFRDYDPNLGRYIESDLIGLHGGINTYAYAGGNPFGYSDPSGLARTTVDAAIEQAISSGNIGELETLLSAAGDDAQISRIETALADLQAANANKPAAEVIKRICARTEPIAKGNDIRKVDELVRRFGGKARDWVKKKGWDAEGREWHWYENNGRKLGWKIGSGPDMF